ncbi:MAG: zinc protease [Pirellulaceae bacterium]|nr:MAG: zinc protease [Pirellulaceae bacterium]
MELIDYRPPGGPQILALHDPAALTASYGWFVNTGARDESADIAGASHFLEHMVFKGTARRSAEQINRELDYLGARSNAFTSEDRTVYYASVLPECQGQAVDLLSDLMQPRLDQDLFELERQVILEEIAMYDDQPPYGAFERAAELFFGDHPLARRVLGTIESVSDLSVEQLQEYHQRRYTKDNMLFVAAGRLRVDELIAQVERLSRDFPAQASSSPQPSVEFHRQSAAVEKGLAHQHYVVMMWPGISWSDERRFALRLLAAAIADSSSSRLFWELIDNGRAETAFVYPQFFRDCGCLTGMLCCAPQDAAEVEEIFVRTVSGVRARPIDARELELARQRITSGLILADEYPQHRMFALGSAWLERQEFLSLDALLAKYAAVDVDDVAAVADALCAEPWVSVRVVEEPLD